MNKIKILDCPMGQGKTSYLIEQINNDKENKYIYITPFLTEVERIINSCKSKHFKQPKNNGGSKLNGFNKLLLRGENIVSTHALFERCNEETLSLLKSKDYVLVLDEVMNVVRQADIAKDDIDFIMESKAIIVDPKTFMVSWNYEKYQNYNNDSMPSRFPDIKLMCDNKSLFYVNNTLMVWALPVDIFTCFKDVYIATYYFKAQIQKYYYDFFNLEYEYYYISKENDNYKLNIRDNNYTEKELRNKFKELIVIIENDKLNAVGESKYSLSKNWYNKNLEKKDNIMFDLLKSNMINFYTNIAKSKSEVNMWTTFKDYKGRLKGKGYTKGFVECSCRATNDYCNKEALSYIINRFLNPYIKTFFSLRDVKVNEELYALTELLQWIYRSRIRQDKEIILYIPSSRMRELLNQWLNNNI